MGLSFYKAHNERPRLSVSSNFINLCLKYHTLVVDLALGPALLGFFPLPLGLVSTYEQNYNEPTLLASLPKLSTGNYETLLKQTTTTTAKPEVN